jgi:hypothetical protein
MSMSCTTDQLCAAASAARQTPDTRLTWRWSDRLPRATSTLCRAKWGCVSSSTVSNPNSTVEQTISHALQSMTQWSKKHSWILGEPK